MQELQVASEARKVVKQETRDAILGAASELIQERGADHLSLREIARRIGYSPAGLYEYFAGKAEIVQAVRQRALEEFIRAMRSVPQHLPSDTYLIQLGMAYITFANRNPEEFLLLFTHRRGSIAETEVETELAQGSYAYLERAIERAMEAGAIRRSAGFDTNEAAYSMWGLAHGLAMLQVSYLRGIQIDFPTVDEIAMRALVKGLGQG
jgi:AcrR family transcriptional regulator